MKCWICIFLLLVSFCSLQGYELPSWLYKQIDNDFEVFSRTGITEKMLDDVMQWSHKFDEYGEGECIRVKVINEKVFQFSRFNQPIHFPIIELVLSEIIENYGLPDLDFVYFYAAGPEIFATDNTTTRGPILAGNKIKGARNVILFHDRMTWFDMNPPYSWLLAAQEVEQAKPLYPWENKINKLFWRGHISDLKIKPEPHEKWQDYSIRGRLFDVGSQFPQFLDIGITGLINLYRLGVDTTGIQIAEKASIEEHLRYKYQICVDGYTCTNPGYAWRLLSNCLTYKVDSPIIQWFYCGLQPWEHYIPVKRDLTDLVHSIQWAIQHDADAKKIMEEGSNFAKKYLLNKEVALAYFHAVLMRYASLQRFTVRT